MASKILQIVNTLTYALDRYEGSDTNSLTTGRNFKLVDFGSTGRNNTDSELEKSLENALQLTKLLSSDYLKLKEEAINNQENSKSSYSDEEENSEGSSEDS